MSLFELLKKIAYKIELMADIGRQYEVYTAVSVPNATMTTIASITVPAGSYVVTGWCEFATYGSATNVQLRLNNTDGIYSGYDRSYFNAGGGCTMTRVWTFEKEETIRLQFYHGVGSTQSVRGRLQLMRIK